MVWIWVWMGVWMVVGSSLCVALGLLLNTGTDQLWPPLLGIHRSTLYCVTDLLQQLTVFVRFYYISESFQCFYGWCLLRGLWGGAQTSPASGNSLFFGKVEVEKHVVPPWRNGLTSHDPGLMFTPEKIQWIIKPLWAVRMETSPDEKKVRRKTSTGPSALIK